jgi:pimeloyl-ACP methyl ester carboxylesterase
MAQSIEEGWVVVPQVASLRETVYGVKTHYAHAGRGEPVVLVHGGGPGASGHSGWSRMMPVLAERFEVFAIDLIGFGLTDIPRVDFSFQTLVNHIAGFVDALDLHNVRICGNSMGAYASMKYVLDNPGRVKSAALISTGTLAKAMGISDDGKAATLPRFDGSKESLVAFLKLIVNDQSKLTDDLIEARYHAASRPGHKEWTDSIDAFRKLMAADSTYRQQYDVKARLPMLTLPWCIIWAGADRTAPLDPLGNRMRELFPKVPFHVVEGSGHQIQNDKPEEANRLVMEFFGEH